MLDPDYLSKVTEGAEQIASEIHAEIMDAIIKRMSMRIKRGEDYLLTAKDKWQIEALQEAGYLREDILQTLARKGNVMESEMREAFEDAGVRNIAYEDKIYRNAGLSPKPLFASPQIVRQMQYNYEKTLGSWQNFTGSTADACQRLFLNALDDAYNDVTHGVKSYTEAFSDAIERAINQGAVVSYQNGKVNRSLESATMTCLRTGISQMAAGVSRERMKEMDWDIVLVSSHLGARDTGVDDYTNHSWWQGKFYSLSGNSKEFPSFDECCAPGDVQGICGANCRHSYGAGDGVHNPYDQYDTEENRRVYEESQKQRAMERGIRNSKRQCQNYQYAIDQNDDPEIKERLQAKYDETAARLTEQNKAYKAFCKDNGLRPLQKRLKIAKWSRDDARNAYFTGRNYNPDETRYLGIPKTWDKDSKSLSTEKNLINPNNKEENCTNCVIAYEMRKRGYHVHADDAIAKKLKTDPFLGWEDTEIIDVKTNVNEEILEEMKKWGDGSRAQLSYKYNKLWKDGRRVGHTICVEYSDNKLTFVDPQKGLIYDEFKRTDVNTLQFARIDKAGLSERGRTACVKDVK